jgi:8-oxo-dGTP diphosphatase
MMPDRTAPGPRAGRPPVAELLLICFAVVDGHLAVLISTDGPAARATLPATPLAAGDDPNLSAASASRTLLGRAPAWSAQGPTTTGASGAALAITYVFVVPAGTSAPASYAWQRIGRGSVLSARDSRAVVGGVELLRSRMDLEPVAFRMLPPVFTLSDLQHLYELLLGRRLHKASFRRSLQASYLVQPTDAWRSEGRGRPAQLFRYAPRRGRGGLHRSVRFEMLR